jgi:hypothetical protein
MRLGFGDSRQLGRQLLATPLRQSDCLDHLATGRVEQIRDALGDERHTELDVAPSWDQVLQLSVGLIGLPVIESLCCGPRIWHCTTEAIAGAVSGRWCEWELNGTLSPTYKVR